MKAPSDDFDEVVEINVVPMLDLAWNLLVVFMIVVTASVQGITVNLPKASAAVSKIKPSTASPTARRTTRSPSGRWPGMWES